MHKFFFHPLTFAILMGTVIMGLIGILFVLPLYCIHTTWNSLIAQSFSLPFINVYQALLLYSAFLILLVLAIKSVNLNKDNFI